MNCHDTENVQTIINKWLYERYLADSEDQLPEYLLYFDEEDKYERIYMKPVISKIFAIANRQCKVIPYITCEEDAPYDPITEKEYEKLVNLSFTDDHIRLFHSRVSSSNLHKYVATPRQELLTNLSKYTNTLFYYPFIRLAGESPVDHNYPACVLFSLAELHMYWPKLEEQLDDLPLDVKYMHDSVTVYNLKKIFRLCCPECDCCAHLKA